MKRKFIVSSTADVSSRVTHAVWVASDSDPLPANAACGLDIASVLGPVVLVDFPALGSKERVCITCATV